jgi:hypothetical protein
MTGLLRCDAVCFGNRNQSNTMYCRRFYWQFVYRTPYRAKHPQLFEKRFSLRLQLYRANGEATVVGPLHKPVSVNLSRLIHTNHAVPMPHPCRAAKGLDCVFPILIAQCGRVWFTPSMPASCHAKTMPLWKRLLKTTAQCGMGMACVN